MRNSPSKTCKFLIRDTFAELSEAGSEKSYSEPVFDKFCFKWHLDMMRSNNVMEGYHCSIQIMEAAGVKDVKFVHML